MLNVELLAANACHEELWNFEFLLCIVTNYRELSMNSPTNLTFYIQHLTFRATALKLLSYSQIDKRLEQYRDVKPPRAVLQVIQLQFKAFQHFFHRIGISIIQCGV